MIDRTNAKEAVYKQKLLAMFFDTSEINTYEIEFRKPDLILSSVKRLKAEHEQRITQLQSKLAEWSTLNSEVKSLEFKPKPDLSFGHLNLNNPKLVSCCMDKTFKIWDLEHNECVETRDGHTKGVRCAEMLVGENKFATGSYDKKIRVWDASDYTCIKTLTGHKDTVFCLKSLAHNRLASGSVSDIKIWHLESGVCAKTLKGSDTVNYFVSN